MKQCKDCTYFRKVIGPRGGCKGSCKLRDIGLLQFMRSGSSKACKRFVESVVE